MILTELESESVWTKLVEGTNTKRGSSPEFIVVERFSDCDQRGVDFLGANVCGTSIGLDLSSKVRS